MVEPVIHQLNRVNVWRLNPFSDPRLLDAQISRNLLLCFSLPRFNQYFSLLATPFRDDGIEQGKRLLHCRTKKRPLFTLKARGTGNISCYHSIHFFLCHKIRLRSISLIPNYQPLSGEIFVVCLLTIVSEGAEHRNIFLQQSRTVFQ